MIRLTLSTLTKEIRSCNICAEYFEHEPRPIVQLNPMARILIAGQAPGQVVQRTGIPFNDASGDRLRDWMGVTREVFYTDHAIAILPMCFCYPGSNKNGDRPPRKECAEAWRHQVIALLPNIRLTLLVGSYAMDWHLKDRTKINLTETVKAWKEYLPEYLPLPHPSPRNNIWLKKNPWFESIVLPELKNRIKNVLDKHT